MEVVWECKYNLEALEGPIYRAHKLVEIPMNYPVEIDECGVFGGANSSCLGCDGVPNSQVGYDCNNICGGDETDCFLNNTVSQPNKINLLHSYPNPFNPSINIEYSSKTLENTSIKIYNLKGELIETLVDSQIILGQHKVPWNGSNYSTGIYFVRLSTGNKIITQKIILLK